MGERSRRGAIALIQSTFLLLAVLGVGACSLKTPVTKTPPPSEQAQEKDFFVKRSEVDGKLVEVPRRFQCAWAPISEQGFLGEGYLTHAAALNDHCNVEFDIEHKMLIARERNPSLPRRDWATILTVPVTSHFDFVRDQDEKGRPRNEWIRRTNQNDWTRRNQFELDITGLEVHKWDYELLSGAGARILAIEDVEWSEHKGKKYWAFTATVTSPGWGSHFQAKYRFNFLEFDEDTTFEPTPYKEENSRHLNVLHVLGKKFQSQAPQLYNAKWDLSGGDNSIEICLFNWPEKYLDLATDTVKEWNDVFAAIGQPRAFWVNKQRKLNYPMDLRCPSMVWVSDPRVVKNSPLGIGLINADVENGKALWGSIIIYGGAFERYAKAYSPSDFSAAHSSDSAMPWISAPGNPFRFDRTPAFFLSEQRIASYGAPQITNDLYAALIETEVQRDPVFELLEAAFESVRSGKRGEFSRPHQHLLGQVPADAQRLLGSTREEDRREGARLLAAHEARVNQLIQSYERYPTRLDRALAYIALNNARRDMSLQESIQAMAQGMREAASRMQSETQATANRDLISTRQHFASRPFSEDLIGSNDLAQPASPFERELTEQVRRLPANQRERFLTERLGRETMKRMRGRVWDVDRTFADEAPGWHAASLDVLNRRDFEDRLRSMLKKTISHEWGHFLGHGHNFKENILPKPGTVPAKYREQLEANVKKYGSALSTVMGYDDGGVKVSVEYDDIKPGPHDYLVARYIYNKQYPVWNGADEDFSFRNLPKDGLMPDEDAQDRDAEGKIYRTTYFPACNDYHASLGLDPYCNRWDRGYDATTLVEGYFQDLEKNWIANTNNLGDTSNVSERALFRWMWSKSFRTFQNVRHFYDYMIAKYRKPLMEISAQSENLYDFYRTCSGRQQNAAIAEVLTREDVNPELIELCKVNGEAITRIGKFLQRSGPDFSEIDHDNWFIGGSITGGDVQVDYSRLWGTWTRLGLLPLKYSALLALTAPHPYVSNFPRWMWPTSRYARSGPEYKNLYATFYPEEFTSAISGTVRQNLLFKSEGAASNSMGRSVLAMGYFLDDLNYSNEIHRGVDASFLEDVMKQNRFDINRETAGYVAIVLNGVKRRGDKAESDRLVGFNATMFDFASREMVPLAVAYVLPDAKVILSSTDQQSFIFPISELRFYKNDAAFAFGIRVSFSENDKSSLWTMSSKVELREKYRKVLEHCLVGTEKNGTKNGLVDFFSISNDSEFRGFLTLPDIAYSHSRFLQFKNSVNDEFKKYWENPRYERAGNLPNKTACKDSLEGIGLVVTSALAVQGWWLPEIRKYIVH